MLKLGFSAASRVDAEEVTVKEVKADNESDVMKQVDLHEIHVDREGEWTYQGNRIIREDILELFYEHLDLSASGEFLIEWGESRCVIGVDDTPFVVTRVDKRRKPETEQEQILLCLKHLRVREVLNPRDLCVGRDNVLYCRVRSGRFPARFSRPAYYQIAQWIEEDPASGEFYLELGPERYRIAAASER